MKYSLLTVCAVACLATGAVVADDEVDESKPIELTALQMDQITAGDLTLLNHPTQKQIFVGFSLRNGNLHPGLLHMILKYGLDNTLWPAEAAWEAHINSPVIICADQGC